ncbi:hypothetical protein OKW40_004045 [Paraburkholderia sp. RAU6.4a]
MLIGPKDKFHVFRQATKLGGPYISANSSMRHDSLDTK